MSGGSEGVPAMAGGRRDRAGRGGEEIAPGVGGGWGFQRRPGGEEIASVGGGGEIAPTWYQPVGFTSNSSLSLITVFLDFPYICKSFPFVWYLYNFCFNSGVFKNWFTGGRFWVMGFSVIFISNWIWFKICLFTGVIFGSNGYIEGIMGFWTVLLMSSDQPYTCNFG